MERKLWWARLISSSPRYTTWRTILGSTEVPLRAPGSSKAQLGPEQEEVYELDIGQLNPDQRNNLVDWISARFGESRETVESNLDREGFPIRSTDVYVMFDMRAFL